MSTELFNEPASAGRAVSVLQTLFGARFARDFSVECWDGTRIDARETWQFTLKINEPFALRAAFAPPFDLSPGRAYVEKWIDVDGDVEAAVAAIEDTLGPLPRQLLPKLLVQLLRLPKPPLAAAEGFQSNGKRHSKRRDAEAIGFHYDQPIAFYRGILGPSMVYSCAYWDDGVDTLEAAQTAKIDHILRKVRLNPGEHLLDIGCGWGSLVIRAAQEFGAHALGVTLSRTQYEEANRRIAEAGVGHLVRVELRDYRDLRGETFDKIVSVGMVEHVGRERLAEYYATAYDALRDGGLFLNHGITQQSRDGKGYRVSGFMDRYVFPDGDLLSIGATLRGAEAAGFEIRDVENLREHYARTLRAWYQNLEENRDEVIAATSERTYRIWKIYMAGCAKSFWRGQMGLIQTLLAKADGGPGNLPATRRDLYC
jgi:cyclopropane-fatty-acyl-phospholipid synthase